MGVNGDNVYAYGLFAEHSLKEQVLWNGNNGYTAFFQSEMPYDVPVGWNHPSYNVTGSGHQLYGGGAYCYFRDNPVKVREGFSAPESAKVSNLVTVWLNGNPGSGILSVYNDKGDPLVSGQAGQSYYCGGFPPIVEKQ